LWRPEGEDFSEGGKGKGGTNLAARKRGTNGPNEGKMFEQGRDRKRRNRTAGVNTKAISIETCPDDRRERQTTERSKKRREEGGRNNHFRKRTVSYVGHHGPGISEEGGGWQTQRDWRLTFVQEGGGEGKDSDDRFNRSRKGRDRTTSTQTKVYLTCMAKRKKNAVNMDGRNGATRGPNLFRRHFFRRPPDKRGKRNGSLSSDGRPWCQEM